jgi:hypothetical protein
MAQVDFMAVDAERRELIDKIRTINIKTDSFIYYNRNPTIADLKSRLKEIENIARVK